MDRVNLILKHLEFINALEKTDKREKERAFCRHGIEHLLEVARIAYILSLEGNSGAKKELIYAVALLHDCGRWRQYEDGTPHEEESARIAARILPECGFDSGETALIIDAILSHRTKNGGKTGVYAGVLYRADKISRRCFECKAIDECDWTIKNMQLEY